MSSVAPARSRRAANVARVRRGAARGAKATAHGLLGPLLALRWRYLPLLMINFASGASALSNVAETFFVKERIGLSAEALVALAIWLTVPWTLKVVFGQLADSIAILGSRRRVYVFAGAALVAVNYGLLAAIAGDRLRFASAESLYMAAALIGVVGVVLQDSVADAMSTEVVRRTDANGRKRPEDEINADLGNVQVLGRLAFMSGTFAVAGASGWLAQRLSYETMFLIALVVPAISITGSLLVRLDLAVRKPLDRRISVGGLAYVAFAAAIAVLGVPYAQEVLFAVSLGVLLYLLSHVLADMGQRARRTIVYAALIIFVFRAMPSFGPGAQWWQIDALGFDPAFFGTLGQWGAAIGIVGTWLFSRAVNHRPVATVLLWLTVAGTALSLPTIAMFYGLHEWTQEAFGFGARAIAIVDTSLASPFVQLSAIPMLTLIAVHAPPGLRATWFALMTSLMNLALQASGLLTKHLNAMFAIERGYYGNLGRLMIATTAISLVVPLCVIGFVSIRIKLRSAVAGDG